MSVPFIICRENSDHDIVTMRKMKNGDWELVFENKKDGYSGATIIPKEIILILQQKHG